MKKILVFLLLAILSTTLASAAMTTAVWKPENTNQKTITDGASTNFYWYAYTSSKDLYVKITLKKGTQTVHTFIDGYQLGASATGTLALTKNLYQNPGTYTVDVYASDYYGDFDREIITLTVQPQANTPPVADFTYSPTSPEAGQSVSFTDQSYDTDGSVVSWSWSFGDGSTSTQKNPSHTYSSAGTRSVTLTVTDDDGATASKTKSITIKPKDNLFQTINVDGQPRSGTVPLAVSFTCSVVGGDAPISYSWTFGDGSSSSQQNPSHTYSSVGSYTARCTATDSDGDTISGTVSITVSPVDHGFTSIAVGANPRSGYAPLAVSFTCSAVGGDAPISYAWLLGDGSSSSQQNPSHTYSSVGSYTARCTATDKDGDTISGTVSITVSAVPNQAPVAGFTYSPSSPVEGQSVSFTDASYDNDGSVVSWYWSFGDGSSSTQRNPSHTYSSAGSYTVTLTVTDDDGATDIESKVIVVSCQDHDFTSISVNANPRSGYAPLAVSFTCSAVGGDAPISYSWVLGDGYTTAAQNPSHVYDAPGSYTARCTATDKDGDTISGTVTITVIAVPVNQPPVARFTYSPTAPVQGQSVQFTDASYDNDGSVVSWYWSFGDGSSSTQRNPSHTYSSAGSYTVTLTVTDDDGATDTESKVIVVSCQDHDFTSISVNANPRSGYAPLAVSFTCSAVGGDAPISYSWSFGDGSSSSQQNPSHVYDAPGSYTARCTATDADGDTISGTVSIMVSAVPNQAPVARFSYSPAAPVDGQSVSFDASASSDADGSIVKYEWDFNNDGSYEATGRTISHSFTAGSHRVTLRVTDDDGATDTESKVIVVSCQDHDFTSISVNANPRSGYAPLAVSFTCSAVGGDAPISYSWVLGDGYTTAAQNPSHVYDAPGSYTARCTATDKDGDTISGTVTITVIAVPVNQPPVARFSYSPSSPVEGQSVSFTDASYDNDGSVVSWYWSFGDGSSSTQRNPSHTYSSAGSYTVTLTVTDDDGATDIESKVIVVSCQDHDFTSISVNANPRSGYAPLAVSFTCSAVGGDAPISYSWSFGDGYVSAAQNPSHVYDAPGSYTARCTATDADGDTISGTVSISVVPQPPLNQPPVAHFSFVPPSPESDTVVTFDAANSYDPDGFIVKYEWDLDNDGSYERSSKVITHVFGAEGDFLVTLRVTDDEGATDTESKTVHVEDEITPIVIDEFGCNPDVVRGERQYCSVHVIDADNADVVDAQVTFTYTDPASVEGEHFGVCTTNFKGYCHVDPIVDEPADLYTLQASAVKAGHLDADPKETSFKVWEQRYRIVDLEVYADDSFSQPEDTFYRGQDMYAAFTIYDDMTESYVCDEELVREVLLRVNNADPLYFEEWQALVPYGLDSPGAIERFLALFGLETPCVYQYWLERIPLTDDYLGDGRVFAFAFNFSDDTAGEASKVVTVLNNPVSLDLPETFTIHKATPAATGKIHINLRLYADDVETAVEDMVFTSAVTTSSTVGEIYVNGMGGGIIEVIAGPGYDYEALLHITVDDTDGSTASDTARILISVQTYPEPPVAVAGPDQQITLGQSASLDGSASYDPDGGSIVSYTWSFGDGSSASGAYASHAYTVKGVYTVTLTVTDDEGDIDTDSLLVTVSKEPYIPVCSDGKDNDHDGLIDMDDPGCESPGDASEHNIASSGPEDGVRILSISTYSDQGYEKASAGDYVTVEVVLENTLDETLEDLRVGFSVPELGVKQKSSQFDLRVGKRVTKVLEVYVPYDAQAYEYYTEITVANDDLRRSTHRLLEVSP